MDLFVPPHPLTMHSLGPTLRDLVVKQEKGMFFSSGHVPSIMGRYTRRTNRDTQEEQTMVHVFKKFTISLRKIIHIPTTRDNYYQGILTRLVSVLLDTFIKMCMFWCQARLSESKNSCGVGPGIYILEKLSRESECPPLVKNQC